MNKKTDKYTNLIGFPGVLAIVVFIADQVSKIWIMHAFPTPGYSYHEIIPGFFNLVYFQNTGAAWGIFSRHTWLLGLFSAAAFFLIVYYYKRLTMGHVSLSFAYGLLLGGIVGNLYDRLIRGFVVDFLFFYWRDFQHSWPAFNVADSAISVSIVMLIVYDLFFLKNEKKSAEKKQGKK
ncbi:MAG: signal peptidase II [Lentisphaeria bacterium]